MKDFQSTTSIHADTVAVYNKLNHDSVIAAAVLKAEMPEVHVCDINSVIPKDKKNYIWIGIDPETFDPNTITLDKNSNHTVISDVFHKHAGYTNIDENGNPLNKKFPIEFKNLFFSETDKKVSLTERVCDVFCFTNSQYIRLGYMASMFHSKTTEADYLVFIYSNLARAQQSLLTGLPFDIKEVNEEDHKAYFEAIQLVKKDFANHSAIHYLHDGETVKKVFYTTMNGFEYHLALRLIKLVHENYANAVYGMNGMFVYTNLTRPNFANLENKPLVLN